MECSNSPLDHPGNIRCNLPSQTAHSSDLHLNIRYHLEKPQPQPIQQKQHEKTTRRKHNNK